MSSSRRSSSPQSHGRSQYRTGKRNDYGKAREQDNGWARRREHEGDSRAERKSERDEFTSRDSKYDTKLGRSRRGDEYSEPRRGQGRGESYGERSRNRSRSRSPPRKRRRSRSRSADIYGGRRREGDRSYGYSSDRHRNDEHRDHSRRGDGREDRALVRREEGAVGPRRSRSGYVNQSHSLLDSVMLPSSVSSEARKTEERRKPNYGNSGLLAAATNTVQRADGSATVLKYNEPPEARKPVEHWRLYEFKDSENTAMLAIHRQSVYLFGRDAAVVDIPLDHPSCSKQHAALQYRHVVEKDEFGEKKGAVKPFIIDLESTNGTQVNGETIPPARYYELKLNDIIKFGTSSREFVLLHEGATE